MGAVDNAPAKKADFPGLLQTLLINSVSVIGVYHLRWPVGTALALYWAENLLTGVVVTGSLALWRMKHAAEVEQPTSSTAEVALITLVFNAAHLAFLFAFLGVMLPRIAPVEQCERNSLGEGLALVAILLMIEFALNAWRMPATSAARMQQTVWSYTQRVVVLHLAIVIGMFALAVFGRARAFFGVFAALKTIVDVSRRVG